MSRADRLSPRADGESAGLGLCTDVIVDQHYIRRSRFNRLLAAVLDHPDKLGAGIDESTAVVVQGREFEVVGRSNVMVIDARKASEAATKDGGPAEADDVALYVLRAGMKFDLDKASFPRRT
ncbi:MAG TPA: hypothetical protein VG013_28270 [Gemmataceae bacterium]|nr:hypothetical protein [Gemmataceae bacterium]